MSRYEKPLDPWFVEQACRLMRKWQRRARTTPTESLDAFMATGIDNGHCTEAEAPFVRAQLAEAMGIDEELSPQEWN